MSQPPLPPQAKYWTRPEERQRVVSALFDRSAKDYDRACGIMSLGSGRAYRRAALERAGLREACACCREGGGADEGLRTQSVMLTARPP